MIKAISFDLWLTLIKSSSTPNKTRRADALYDMLRPAGIDRNEFARAVLDAEHRANENCINNPVHFGPRERLALVTSHFGLPELTDEQFTRFYREQSERFLQYPPELIRRDTIEVLQTLSKDYVLACLSNTGFVNGAEMRPTLRNLGVLDFLKVQIFSDEAGLNKPHRAIFEKLTEAIGCEPHEVLHIGDDRVADYEGALAAGLQAIHISDPNMPLRAILAQYL